MNASSREKFAQNFFAFSRFVREVTGDYNEDIHVLIHSVMEEVKEVEDRGFFLKDIDSLTLNKSVLDGLREIIKEHGDLKKLFIGAAAKRIVEKLILLKGRTNAKVN